MITRRNKGKLVIRIKKSKEKIRLVTIFAFLMIACLPFHTLTIGGMGLLMLLGLPLIVLSLPKLINRMNRTSWDPATITLAAFFGYNLLSYMLSPAFSVDSVYNYVKIIAVVVCLYCQAYNDREKRFLIAASFVSCMILCWFLLTGTGTGMYDDRVTIAVFGVVQDPNYLGYLFLIPMAVSVQGFLKDKRVSAKIVYALLVGLIMLCAMTGGSRGAFLGIAAVAVVCVIKRFDKMSTKILFCLGMAAFAVSVYGFMLTLLPEHIAARFSIQMVLESRGTKRLDLWMKAFQVMKERPYKLLLGFGAGSSDILLGGWATHNFFIQLLLELGIIGLSLFLSFLRIWLMRLSKYDTKAFSILMGCMAMAMTLSVNTIYYFWVVFILGLITSKTNENGDGE